MRSVSHKLAVGYEVGASEEVESGGKDKMRVQSENECPRESVIGVSSDFALRGRRVAGAQSLRISSHCCSKSSRRSSPSSSSS